MVKGCKKLCELGGGGGGGCNGSPVHVALKNNLSFGSTGLLTEKKLVYVYSSLAWPTLTLLSSCKGWPHQTTFVHENLLLYLFILGHIECDWQQTVCLQHCRLQCAAVCAACSLHAAHLWVELLNPTNIGLFILISFCLSLAHELVLEVFQALTSNTQIVKESIQKGIVAVIWSRMYVYLWRMQ